MFCSQIEFMMLELIDCTFRIEINFINDFRNLSLCCFWLLREFIYGLKYFEKETRMSISFFFF